MSAKFFCSRKLIEKVKKLKLDNKDDVVRTWSRDSMIIPDFVGQKFLVHNGKNFKLVYVTTNMVGHKLGEFVFTRVFAKHPTGKSISKSGVKK